MRRSTLLITLILFTMVMALAVPVIASPPDSATIQFGDPNAGSPFPPGEHDRSYHAVDKMVPRTVSISSGGSVTFNISPFHQVAIYAPGTTPDDIELSDATLDDLHVPFPPFVIPNIIINDADGRLALAPSLSFTDSQWTTPDGTFDVPGRYLVICTTLPHFAEADMFGWVIVE